MGFPVSSAGQESTCNAGDPDLIPGSERSPGKGIGYLLQYSWASLVAQTVKDLRAVQETWVQSLGWEDPLKEGMTNPPQYSCLENPHGQRSLQDYNPWGCKELETAKYNTAQILNSCLLKE